MILFDTHVHIYSCFDLRIFFDSALANFRKEAERNGKHEFTAILFLTDWSGKNWFKSLAGFVENKHGKNIETLPNWTFHTTNEKCSIYAKHSGGQGVFIVAGRKIITRETLEVLALATNTEFEDGSSLEDAVRNIKDKDAVPVIPWAAGKWIGRRGRVLRKFIEGTEEPYFFLCDNGNRPIFWPKPNHFKLAERKGIRVLSGSDPLHFPSEVGRAGSFGVLALGNISREQPAKELLHILLDGVQRLRLYGRLENPYRFLRNQLAMQILKRTQSSNRRP